MEEDAACETVERIVTATKKLAAINLEVCNKYVYRGTDFLPEDIGREMRVGECFSDPGFLSTTSDEEQCYSGEFPFMILSKTGVDISAFSVFRLEREVLFRPGTVFEIMSVDRHDGVCSVVLEEVGESLW